MKVHDTCLYCVVHEPVKPCWLHDGTEVRLVSCLTINIKHQPDTVLVDI